VRKAIEAGSGQIVGSGNVGRGPVKPGPPPASSCSA